MNLNLGPTKVVKFDNLPKLVRLSQLYLLSHSSTHRHYHRHSLHRHMPSQASKTLEWLCLNPNPTPTVRSTEHGARSTDSRRITEHTNQPRSAGSMTSGRGTVTVVRDCRGSSRNSTCGLAEGLFKLGTRCPGALLAEV